MIIDLLQRRFYEVIKKAADKNLKKDTKIFLSPKPSSTLLTNRMKKNGPLFENGTKTATWLAFAAG